MAITKNVYDVHEFSLDFDGYNYLVIYGSHVNGGFIAIPNWETCVEASDVNQWDEVSYNAEKLSAKKSIRKAAARAIAKTIREHYATYLKKLTPSGEGVWQHFGDNGRYVCDGKIKASYQAVGISRHFWYQDEAEAILLQTDEKTVSTFMEQRYSDNRKAKKQQAEEVEEQIPMYRASI